jgi:hypothetical protein
MARTTRERGGGRAWGTLAVTAVWLMLRALVEAGEQPVNGIPHVSARRRLIIGLIVSERASSRRREGFFLAYPRPAR